MEIEELASAVPIELGVLSAVLLSELEDPVSLLGSRDPVGVLGAVVSNTTVKDPEEELRLPARSTPLAVTE